MKNHRRILAYAQKMSDIEMKIRVLVCSEMTIEDKAKGLDKLRVDAGEDDDSSWEGIITQMTHEIRQDLDELDVHVAPSIAGR